MRSCSQHSRVVGLSLESGFSALWMRCCTRAAPEPVGGACHGIDPQRPRLTGYFAHGSQDFRDGVMERRVWSGQQDSFAEERETGSAVHLSPQYRARGDCLLIVSKAVGEGAQGRQFVGADGVGPCGRRCPPSSHSIRAKPCRCPRAAVNSGHRNGTSPSCRSSSVRRSSRFPMIHLVTCCGSSAGAIGSSRGWYEAVGDSAALLAACVPGSPDPGFHGRDGRHRCIPRSSAGSGRACSHPGAWCAGLGR